MKEPYDHMMLIFSNRTGLILKEISFSVQLDIAFVPMS